MAITLAQLEAAERHAEEKRRAIATTMAAAMPKNTIEPEALARETLEVFENGIIAGMMLKGFDIQAQAEHQDMKAIREALARLDVALADASAFGHTYLAHHLKRRGVDLAKFDEWMRIFEEVVSQPPERQAAPGRPKQDATRGALRAAECLMSRGLKRKRAAQVIEVLMIGYAQTIDSRIEPKSADVLEQTIIRDEGLTNRPRKTHIWLTPGC
jgi:hypothetical protein